MEEHKFQFLGLLAFGILVLLTGLFSSGSNLPITSHAVSNSKPGVFLGLTVSAFLLILLGFYQLKR